MLKKGMVRHRHVSYGSDAPFPRERVVKNVSVTVGHAKREYAPSGGGRGSADVVYLL